VRKVAQTIPFAGVRLDQARYVCGLFNNEEEEHRVLLPLITDRFDFGHKAVHVVNDDAVICVYDLAKFSGDTVIDVMRIHPMVIVGGIPRQNPLLLPPKEFLRELHLRRNEQGASQPTVC
jgi:hypothetical protein